MEEEKGVDVGFVKRQPIKQKCSLCGRERRLLGVKSTNDNETELKDITGYWIIESPTHIPCKSHSWKNK